MVVGYIPKPSNEIVTVGVANKDKGGKMKDCEICGRKAKGNAGDYYHAKECRARHYQSQLKSCNESERSNIEKRLEQARYVGD